MAAVALLACETVVHPWGKSDPQMHTIKLDTQQQLREHNCYSLLKLPHLLVAPRWVALIAVACVSIS